MSEQERNQEKMQVGVDKVSETIAELVKKGSEPMRFWVGTDEWIDSSGKRSTCWQIFYESPIDRKNCGYYTYYTEEDYKRVWKAIEAESACAES
jgi:hypothetical protein